MEYRPGDYVFPNDLPRPLLCRVSLAEHLDIANGPTQILRLEPLEGPWPTGTTLVRLNDYVLSARPHRPWVEPSPGRPQERAWRRPTAVTWSRRRRAA